MIEDIIKTLWATADKLRANMDAAEYKQVVLGLFFLKNITDTFQTRRTEDSPLRVALLPRLISGLLRLPHAEALVEEAAA